MSQKSKKDASMESMLNAASKVDPENNVEPEEKKGRGRPKKAGGKRQQLPVYLPEPLYYQMLDHVNLQKRSNRQYSLNDLVLEGLGLWLADNGMASLDELIEQEK